ncbi:peptidoglycan-associated lipoprotein Pal [Geobacter pelophilus]|uniref:Peptidoglycan-associated lipoprotein n=1 Tax=Geoanaerobacter pelophilus TaxID=60036 RepID=A0AAW4L8R7_9BACT|nr:peptidoglycan-associated lipoprotein Pal [Geoanaerobacter pelophilus]MBT0664222.1 peptidoglycan-associated lipoprotein Pal [Geoanaerobacter pelophilus]
MKTGGSWLSALLLCSLVAASGCAKQELVKKEDSMAPAASTVAKQSASSELGKNAALTKQESAGVPVKPTTPAADQEVTAKATAKAALEKVYFGFDSAVLSDQAREVLVSNAKYLKNNPAAKIRIEGNCDERGSAEYNLALGEKRAKSAQSYLVSMGVSPERLSTISYGKEKPFDSGHDESAWAKNRRDEFAVLSK